MKPQPPHPETSLPLPESEKAKKLLSANFVNLGKKVLSGAPLTSAEVQFLKDYASESESKEEEAPKAAKSKKKTPRFAKNKTELANILGVSRWTIQRESKTPGAPKARSDGRLDVEAWKEHLENEDVLEGDEQAALKAHQILLQNEMLEHKISVAKGLYVAAIEVEQEVADMIATAKSVLLSGPSSLAPQVVGVSVPEAETLLKEWLHSALTKLQKNPLGRTEIIS